MINIDEKIKIALLNKDEIAIKVFRAIKAEILKFKTQKNAPVYDDNAEINLLSKISKRYDESIEAFIMGNRDDLAASEKAEKEIIEQLLPKAVEKESIEIALKVYIEEQYDTPNIPKKDMGKIIKYLKNMFPVNDGKEISEIVKTYIS